MAENPQTFNFELVSPDKVMVSEPAWQVTIPGEEGYFGVRAGHMSLIAAVRPGVVEVIKKEGETPERIFIAGGFADVTAANCTVLAEQAVNVNQIDAGAVQAELQVLRDELGGTTEMVQKIKINKKIEILSLKLLAAQSKEAA